MTEPNLTPTPVVEDTPWIQRSSTKRSIATVAAALATAATGISALLADGVFSPADQFTAAAIALGVITAFLGETSTSAARNAVASLAERVVPDLHEVKRELAKKPPVEGFTADPDPERLLPPLSDVDLGPAGHPGERARGN